MDELPARFALRARWVLPVASPPVANGFVAVDRDRIASVAASAPDCPIIDCGNAAIIPGLVNAHVHLDLSHFESPIGTPGMRLPDWIRQVIAARLALPSPALDVVARGIRESLAAGTTALGDIATIDWRAAARTARHAMPDVVVFGESIAPTAERVATAVAQAETFQLHCHPHHIRPGISPHAPYTVRPELLSQLTELSWRASVPVAMHLAESREELQLLESGEGPFREMLADVGAWDPAPDARYTSVHAYLLQLVRAPQALIIHGNYLSQNDLAFLSEHAATMSVVYCPRTHDYFRHDPYPLRELLARGINVAVGSDSRASNPDLSVLAELKFVAKRYPDLEAATVLELGTIRGAKGLGLADELGTLEPGKLASMAVVALPATDAIDPYAALLAPESSVGQTFVRGRPVLPLTGDSW
jgi:cytosine/adenosine deaminase-related metal-dependent hydrolase